MLPAWPVCGRHVRLPSRIFRCIVPQGGVPAGLLGPWHVRKRRHVPVPGWFCRPGLHIAEVPERMLRSRGVRRYAESGRRQTSIDNACRGSIDGCGPRKNSRLAACIDRTVPVRKVRSWGQRQNENSLGPKRALKASRSERGAVARLLPLRRRV